jgi:hypothetical protein
MNEKVRNLLVRARIPGLYQRIIVWWEFHSSLRDQLKAFRILMLNASIALRNSTIGTVMLVAQRQVQSRDELRDMSHAQIMAAWRDGRLAYLMQRNNTFGGVSGYGDMTFHEWVKNGGQIR